jgi:hypothetical protein
MNKLLVGISAAGLLLSASAMAQNTSTDNQKSSSPSATTTQSEQGSTKGSMKRDTGRVHDGASRTPQQSQTQTNTTRERSASDLGARSEHRNSVSTRGSRSTVGFRIHERDEWRHRRGYRVHVGYGPHCRNIVVKKRYHHHVVVKHIRRCV